MSTLDDIRDQDLDNCCGFLALMLSHTYLRHLLGQGGSNAAFDAAVWDLRRAMITEVKKHGFPTTDKLP